MVPPPRPRPLPVRLSCEPLEDRLVPAPVIRLGTAANAAGLQAIVNTFRADLGGGVANPDSNGSFLTGRREVLWDEVPDNLAAPALTPGDFYNKTLLRGLNLVDSTGVAGLLVSMDDDNPPDTDPDQVRFSHLNPTYAGIFQTFSGQRLFAPAQGTVTEVTFQVPGLGTQATVNGFGAVFSDVDNLTATAIEFLGAAGQSLGRFLVPAADDGLSFLGVSFNAGERVSRVRITSGNSAIGSPSLDDVDGPNSDRDVVALDDLLYGEPQALPDLLGLDLAGQNLIRFSAGQAGAPQPPIPIVGLDRGESLAAIDYRPLTGELYGLVVSINSSNGRLVVVDPLSGQLTSVGAPFPIAGNDFGFDFNPVADRIRVVSDADINLSINPTTGDVTTQTPLNPGDPVVLAVAYTNSVPRATTTTLFGVDRANLDLVRQDPPASGTLTVIGKLGVTDFNVAGFDIEGGTNLALAVLTLQGSSQLFQVNLENGTILEMGRLPQGLPLRGLAIIPPPRLSINDVAIAEGNAGTTNVTFTITLRGGVPTNQVATVRVRTQDGTATAGSDYTALPPQILTFMPGTTTQTLNVTVSVLGDLNLEPNESFAVVLEQPTGAVIERSPGTGTILNDDRGQTPAECYVAQVYRDLLGREADAGGLGFFASLLDRRILTRAGVAQALQFSTEYGVKEVDALYRRLLRRPLDGSGRGFWLTFLDRGGSLEGVAANILGSDEYFALSGSTNDQFLDAVYRDVLGRAVDASGRASWTGELLLGKSRTDVAGCILTSREANLRDAAEVFTSVLRRAPDSAALNNVAALLDGGRPTETARSLLHGSDEYFARFCPPTVI